MTGISKADAWFEASVRAARIRPPMPSDLAGKRKALRVAMLGVCLFLSCLGAAAVPHKSPDQLVMFRAPGCPYCAEWDKEIGIVYGKTDEAKVLPLRQLNIGDDRPPDLAGVKGIFATPTFVILHCGQEVARITGYIGEYQFWGLLDKDVALVKGSPACRA